eukprot:768621-Hanusia_phi.AAC.4
MAGHRLCVRPPGRTRVALFPPLTLGLEAHSNNTNRCDRDRRTLPPAAPPSPDTSTEAERVRSKSACSTSGSGPDTDTVTEAATASSVDEPQVAAAVNPGPPRGTHSTAQEVDGGQVDEPFGPHGARAEARGYDRRRPRRAGEALLGVLVVVGAGAAGLAHARHADLHAELVAEVVEPQRGAVLHPAAPRVSEARTRPEYTTGYGVPGPTRRRWAARGAGCAALYGAAACLTGLARPRVDVLVLPGCAGLAGLPPRRGRPRSCTGSRTTCTSSRCWARRTAGRWRRSSARRGTPRDTGALPLVEHGGVGQVGASRAVGDVRGRGQEPRREGVGRAGHALLRGVPHVASPAAAVLVAEAVAHRQPRCRVQHRGRDVGVGDGVAVAI